MKVLHVVHGYPPSIGGTQRLVAAISERLVTEYGDELTVFTTNALSNYHFWQQDERTLPVGTSRINGVTVRRFGVFNRWSRWRLRVARLAYRWRLPGNDWARALYNGPLVPGLADAIARHDADLVVAASFPLLHMHTALRGATRGSKPVIFIGGLHSEDIWGFDRPMIYRAIRRADRYIAYTDFEKRHLIERGIPDQRIDVTGIGVDPQDFAEVDPDRWRRENRCSNDLLIAFVGQQAPHKGIETLLEAMPRIWTTVPGARLAIAGQPTAYTRDLRSLVDRLTSPRPDSIRFLDAPADQETAELIAACDLLVLPSRHESFGLVLLEAWTCAKPVVAARIGALAAVVDEGVDGLLTTPGDPTSLAQAVDSLLAAPERRAEMGQAGRAKVLARYTWDRVLPRFRAVYERCLS